MHQASAHQPTALATAVHGALSHYDPITIGMDSRGVPVLWCFPQVANFNAIFMGGSGAGKTHTLHNMVANVYVRGMTFHIIDIKGDFRYENFVKSGLGHMVDAADFNDLVFNYYTDGISLNPLKVPKTIEGGGVFRTIENAIELVKVFNPQTGQKQLAYLTEILKRVYSKAGIDHDNMDTWTRESPTFATVLEEIDLIIGMMTSGMDAVSAGKIMGYFAYARQQALSKVKSLEENGAMGEAITAELIQVAEDFKGKLGGLVDRLFTHGAITNQHVFESADWEHWSKESLLSLRSIINVMVDTRLFTQSVARPRNGMINRYDLGNLSPRHQQVIMRIIANQVFAMGVMETKSKDTFNPKFPAHILVADEGKHIKEISASAISPFNRIVTEGRGYGVGAWAGVQSPDQVTKDMMKNSDTSFLLKTPEASVKDITSMFGAKPAQLKLLEVKKNALFSSGSGYSLVEHFR